ncbi:BMP family ABC transporter substrate-binding protein [Tessaracoccus aquimaris]|uniref:BMP family ABC transporter substrate-binding protein n=1 Tax=Tessaracoccus aquimaris TaxID=1332264 RepID=A0A1Q2CPU3_9ACTN|nr:ABC transporter substrate-binding protein [Tessaracoccus aquimaris]AQP48141.1 BMP family ABC transporter substrate-binding protein [Tessaracoccus aquimaris]
MRILRSAIAASAVLMLGLSACATSTPATSPAPTTDKPSEAPASSPAATPETSAPATEGGDVPKGDGTQTIYLVSKGFQHRFWQAVKEGAEQAGKEYNYKIQFVGPDDETKVTQQLDQLKTALDSKPAAIGFAALDTGAAADVLSQIEAAKIPMIAFDSGVDSDLPLTTVQTDNFAAAQEAAKHMAELVGNKGTVGLVCHDQTSQTGKQRCEGFQDWMKTNAPDIKVLAPQYAGEVGLAANTAKAMIQANPDIVGVYGSNEAAATGAVQGTIESGKEGITVVGFDSGKTQLDAIRNGQMAGAITQAPVKMGYETVVSAIKAIDGQELPKVTDSGFAWYDKNNIDDPEIAANLYE